LAYCIVVAAFKCFAVYHCRLSWAIQRVERSQVENDSSVDARDCLLQKITEYAQHVTAEPPIVSRCTLLRAYVVLKPAASTVIYSLLSSEVERKTTLNSSDAVFDNEPVSCTAVFGARHCTVSPEKHAVA